MKNELTIYPKFAEPDEEPIELLRDGGDSWGVPVLYGLKKFQIIRRFSTLATAYSNTTTQLSDGRAVEFDRNIVPRDSEQAQFFDKLYAETSRRPVALGEAPTGSGKTVAALDTISRIGKSALIIVPTKRLARQWAKEITAFLNIAPEDIGTIVEGKFDYRDKDITIAVIHNLVNKEEHELPESFATSFGTVVWDEAHNLGARKFSLSMERVYARHRLALSATPERLDGCENVFLYYFGQPAVVHQGDALAAKCHVFNFNWGGRAGAGIGKKPRAIIQKILVASESRNLFLADKIARLYRSKREILVIGAQIDHLQLLMGYCSRAGVPDDAMGLYTRQYIEEYETTDKKTGKPVSKTRRKPITDEQLDWVAENCTILFATYQMAKEGLDIPRLDAGIDITPRSQGTQVIGRIRRPLEGKPVPLWVTIRDVGIHPLMQSCRNRLQDYRENNVTITDHGTTKKS